MPWRNNTVAEGQTTTLPPRSAASPSTTSTHNTMRGSVESTTSSRSRSWGFVTPCHGLLPSPPPAITQSSARRHGRPSTICKRPPDLRGGSGQSPADPDSEWCVVPCSVVILPACPWASVPKHRNSPLVGSANASTGSRPNPRRELLRVAARPYDSVRGESETIERESPTLGRRISRSLAPD
jgi:hypothetical protein